MAAVGEQSLQLEVFINARPTHLIGAFKLSATGDLSAQASELRSLGLKTPKGRDGSIALAELPGVTARYEERTQSVYLTAEDRALIPHEIWIRPRPAPTVVSPPGLGAVINYDVFAQGGDALNPQGSSFARLSTTFDARIFGPAGVLENQFIAEAGASDDLNGLHRLSTAWNWTDPQTLVAARAGDLISGGFEWTRPIRMAGLQLRRDFALRPDLITMPTPTIGGSAAVPSTLEVYANQQPVFVGGLEPGPFLLQNVPVVDGYDETRLVLRDASGGQRTIVAPFFTTPDLLSPGLVDYSAELGFAQRNFGLATVNYDGQPVASGSVRYGATGDLTLQGHAEGGAGVAEGGAGAVTRLGHLGVLALAVAGSEMEGQVGGQARLGLQAQYRGLFFGGSVQQTFGDYADVAAATQPKILKASAWNVMASPPRQLAQLSVSAPLTLARFDQPSAPMVSVIYAGRSDVTGQRDETLSVGLRDTLPRFTVYSTAFQTVSGASRLGFFIGLSMPLNSRTTVSVGAQNSGSGASAFVDAVHQMQAEPGSIGWALHADAGAQDDLTAAASYMTREGRLDSDVEIRPEQVEAQLRFDGALVAMGGGVFAAPTVQNAFAVVDAGEPGVAVRFQNRLIGVTDAQGRLLAPGLNANEANALDIDPATLPLNVEIDSTHASATPAFGSGVLVKFKLTTSSGTALVTLKTASGEVVPPGSRAILAATGEAFIVGYDGQVFVKNLGRANELRIARSDGAACIATFTFTPNDQEPVHALDAVCG